ncbi:transglutaminase-like cysteine peptidase [Paradevosia shaoguanensis]|uniref:transglutaminase-like cysteine peptidase n=1 Tax=Paradevosia shaoguanensis TaxID=1335043 RepID=UPI00050309E8|nr:transglutaminase [Devosia sp. 17-2-E-8]MBI4045247.1 transglutaminase-like cysteine peptidase [Devosia nanyangense]QMV01565.1 transglutaminase [Devosia sp. D6-9]
MSTASNIAKILGAALLAAIAFAAPAKAQSVDFTNAAFVQVSINPTSIPVGAADFCHRRGAECAPYKNPIAAENLTDMRWSQLVQVNAAVNAAVTPVSDKELYGVEEFWTYPTSGYGDCEDFALEKRRQLIDLGWAPSTLMIAVVRQANGEGHAVLMVRTDRGDLVLDNQAGDIRLWNETPYRYLKRQSQLSFAQWVDISDDRTTIVTASAGR